MDPPARAALALLLCSAVPPLVFFVFSPLSDSMPQSTAASDLGCALTLFPFSFIAVFALGWPSFLLLQKLKWVYWWSVLLGGFFLGCITLVIFGAFHLNGLRPFPIWGGAGAGSAFLFWLIYGRHANGSAGGR
jgi:hypothetical protein